MIGRLPRTTLRLAGIAALLLMLAFVTTNEAAAQYGKISGTVTDAATGEPLIGVNVIIDGTATGATTNLDGDYVIIGVRPGQYAITASYIGYQSVRVEEVRVQIDLTTDIDFSLPEEVIEGQEIVITADRPLIQKDVTATTASVSGEEIRAIPVENFQDVVNLQAGVVNGHFRGGRTGEVGYWVDGMPVSDVYDGGLAVAVENDLVQEMQVVTGAFNAEYGQAMSGIVNVVTRDGSNDFTGGFSGFAGDYGSNRTQIFNGIDNIDPLAVRNVEANLGGPILKNRLFFFTSGRYFQNDGWVQGRNVFSFNDVGVDPSNKLALLNPGGTGDSSIVQMNPYEKVSGQAKLTLAVTNRIRLAANTIISQETFKSFDGDGDLQFLYMPQNQLDKKRWARTTYLKWTHTLSNRTFYEAGVTNNYSAYRQWLFEDPLDNRYMDHEVLNFSDVALTSGFKAGGTNNGRFSRSTNTFLAKVDITSQITDANMVKLGVEGRMHDLRFNDSYVIRPFEDQAPAVAQNGRFHYKPMELSAYIQDKVEMGDLIINLGVRFDYFDSNGRVLKDPTKPQFVFEQQRFELYPEDLPSDLTKDQLYERLYPYFTEDASPRWQFSPRLGVAFPISQGGVIHFSYGRFFQIPNFENLYQNPYFLLSASGSGLVGLMGNANLKPEETTNGEIGLKQQLSGSTAIELTAYYRDIRNLAGTATNPIVIEGTGARYGMLINSDFGFVRGVVFRFDQTFGDGFFAGADYTYQIAKANASDPAQVYNAAAAKQDLPKQIVATNWDQRHTINVTAAYTSRQNWGFGLVGSLGSGQPYTPAQTTQQSGLILPTTIQLNSETRPTTFNINLNVFKNFTVAGSQNVQVFAKIDNLLDTKNEYGVFGDTGRATYSLQKNVDAASYSGSPLFLDSWYVRPYFYSQPRRVVLGLEYRF